MKIHDEMITMSIRKAPGLFKQLLLLTLLGVSGTAVSQIKLETVNTESILYFGSGDNQPLVVGLGGSEGGNAWTSDYWKKERDKFLENGYAFLAIGYFGCKNTPAVLDKISINDVHNAILEAAKNKQMN